MKSLKIRKILAAIAAALTIAALSPISASAEWKHDNSGWWNTEGSSYSVGWESIDGVWYYFGSDGYMKTGWVNDGGIWYYMQPSGAMKAGWLNDKGTWYYMQPSGAMSTSWVNDGGVWYYMQPSGAMKTGWINDNGVMYFASASGAMQTGVIKIDNKIYYFAPNGAMQKGQVTINGVVYTFAATGEAIGDKVPALVLAFTSAGAPVSITNPTETADTNNTVKNSTSNHHGGGYSQLTEQLVENQYKASTEITKEAEVDKNADGTTTIKPAVSFTPGTYKEYIYATGKTYTVTKDVYITLNGKDAYITGDYTNGYKLDKGASGAVEISANISILDSDSGKLYYVASSKPEEIMIK
ncbi:cell wall binding repeat-containing protein [Clostridium sp. DL-VIII]|uniref:N-acetylmuramoyl-L-alanine amidase family protein n=1 Tax=Clostridium sp. DL-VIII TaxID=641107 RepID=UPI00023AFD21|nr:N-acetylmuramoyl-L-alanine amidase family protein [Clostridium sp. DL-VIII]EHI98355.1 cell wall binding repeat-containing protein [Clostridium sp. DL-VIII]